MSESKSQSQGVSLPTSVGAAFEAARGLASRHQLVYYDLWFGGML